MHPEPFTTCGVHWTNYTHNKVYEQYVVVLVSSNYIVSSNFMDKFTVK